MVPVRYNARSLVVRKVTTLATALGIALVVFVFAGALMLGGISRVLAAAGRADTVIIMRKGSDAELTERDRQRATSGCFAARRRSPRPAA